YGAAGGLIVVALAQGEHPYAQWTWVTVFLIAAFLYFVFLVMRQLVRRTDSATAATVFVDYQRAAYAAAGRYLGVVQRHAIDDLAELEDMPHVRVVTTPVRTV